jgi:hypothetical protein
MRFDVYKQQVKSGPSGAAVGFRKLAFHVAAADERVVKQRETENVHLLLAAYVLATLDYKVIRCPAPRVEKPADASLEKEKYKRQTGSCTYSLSIGFDLFIISLEIMLKFVVDCDDK